MALLSRSPKESILAGWPGASHRVAGAACPVSPRDSTRHTSAGAARTDVRAFEFFQRTPRSAPVSTGRAVRPGVSDADRLFKCPICLDVIVEASKTPCGHAFCHECISAALLDKAACPVCSVLTSMQQLCAHTELDELIRLKTSPELSKRLRALPAGGDLYTLDISALLMDVESAESEDDGADGDEGDEREDDDVDEAVLQFLLQAKQEKINKIIELQRELQAVSSDLESLAGGKDALVQLGKRAIESVSGQADSSVQKRRRIAAHFPDLESAYFELREDDMESFSSIVSGLTKFSKLRSVASIRYDDILRQSSTIISSIEFSGNQECFATAGVNCKIKVFNFASVVHEQLDASVHTQGVYTHFPMQELNSRAKISCLSWNPSVMNQLASTDAEGVVTLWDAHVGESVCTYHEHSQRAWSVDYAHASPSLFATGSDDCTVKLWSPSSARSVTSIDCKANVCSVKFNPFQRQYIAFGCADRLVHYYDLRNPAMPLFVMKDHKKAVSYVDFFPGGELMSSSTDSTLKLWDIDSAIQDHRIRTFSGHKNLRNFVGMSAASRDYVVCGSEDDRLYVYHKELSTPVASYSFSNEESGGRRERGSQSPFITSVCWKKHSNTIIGANSSGIVNVLELV